MIHIKLFFDKAIQKNTHPDMFNALKKEVKKKLSPSYSELEVSALWGSQTKLIIDGLKKNEKKRQNNRCIRRNMERYKLDA